MRRAIPVFYIRIPYETPRPAAAPRREAATALQTGGRG